MIFDYSILKKKYKDQNMNLDELSYKSGICKNYLVSIFKNRVNPTAITLYKISKGLGIAFFDLIKLITIKTDTKLYKK